MKRFSLLCCICMLWAGQTMAQLNVSFVSQFEYNENLNDIWGYVAPDGTEYALVGAANGTSIVSLANPAAPEEVGYIPGANSVWRDIKTWDTYAYVTTDQGEDGLTVIDLSDLPNSVSSTNVTDIPGVGTLTRCHNIYIDEFGFAYLAGCNNINNGGMVIYDVATDPAIPEFVSLAPNVYSHDVYVRDNLMYSSEIYDGVFAIYDVSDKNNIPLLGSQQTAFDFTHNTWLSDDGNFIFTTDETGNAPIGSYDISDPTDIIEMDQFVPLITEGDGVIPHNVHVWNDWIIVSYYTDGCIVIDGSNPGNLIEVGNFDSYVPPTTGFNGAWGAYPFLPSGLILLTDIGNGLYVLEPNYVRACWLEGTVVDSITQAPINNASVEIIASQLNGDNTDATGAYQTGLATAGTYDVLYTAPGYQDKIYSAVMDNDMLTIINAELVADAAYAISGQITDASDGSPIENAIVHIVNDDFNFQSLTDANGNFTFSAVFEGDYAIAVGKWGYNTQLSNVNVSGGPSNFSAALTPGYRDEFAMDLNWQITGNAQTGAWEIGEPNGTTYQGQPANTDQDISTDLGDQCYVTGNAGGNAGNDDVDNGTTTLTSPSMDLSGYNSPIVSFYAWFFNDGGQGGDVPNDALEVTIDNGSTAVVLLLIENTTNQWEGPFEFVLADYIDITDDMTISFETSDLQGSGHLVEAAIDLFEVTDIIAYAPFTASAATGCAPQVVEFTDQGTGATSWNWTFEGGSPSSSTLQNPTVTYNSTGSYAVSLNVTTATGTASVSEDDFIVINGAPTSVFTTNQISDAEIAFMNQSVNADSYMWDFGDGSTSNEENPTHTYGASDSYTVSLTTTNECGSTTTTITLGITITSVADINPLFELNASPNPFSEQVNIQYDLPVGFDHAQLVIYNIVGKKVFQQDLDSQNGIIIIDEDLLRGVYLARIESDGVASKSLKLVKAK